MRRARRGQAGAAGAAAVLDAQALARLRELDPAAATICSNVC